MARPATRSLHAIHSVSADPFRTDVTEFATHDAESDLRHRVRTASGQAHDESHAIPRQVVTLQIRPGGRPTTAVGSEVAGEDAAHLGGLVFGAGGVEVRVGVGRAGAGVGVVQAPVEGGGPVVVQADADRDPAQAAGPDQVLGQPDQRCRRRVRGQPARPAGC